MGFMEIESCHSESNPRPPAATLDTLIEALRAIVIGRDDLAKEVAKLAS